MKWYQTAAIVIAILIVLYMTTKMFSKSNVYTYIEPSLPEPPDAEPQPNQNHHCGGTSYLGDRTLPLGFRNNNPLNLIQSKNAWKGKIKNAPGRFEQFCSMEYGTRAAMINLRSYINRYGRNTITKIISKWAPATENDTQAYIDFVSKEAAIGKNQVISFSKQTIFRLVDAMAKMENGASFEIENYIMEQAWNIL